MDNLSMHSFRRQILKKIYLEKLVENDISSSFFQHIVQTNNFSRWINSSLKSIYTKTVFPIIFEIFDEICLRVVFTPSTSMIADYKKKHFFEDYIYIKFHQNRWLMLRYVSSARSIFSCKRILFHANHSRQSLPSIAKGKITDSWTRVRPLSRKIQSVHIKSLYNFRNLLQRQTKRQIGGNCYKMRRILNLSRLI